MLPQNVPSTPSAGARSYSPENVAAAQATFIRKVYAFMAAGLGATGLTALAVVNSETALRIIFGNRLVFYALLIGELLMVWTFSRVASRLSGAGAAALFFVYAVMNGLTLSVIFLVYTRGSIASTFFVTAGTFAAISGYGYFTKRDLTSVGSFMIMGLFGLIIASVVNLWLGSPMLYWATTCFGVLIFVGLTAYDTQKIKEMSVIGNAGSDEDTKDAIHGALQLYLDFVNLFLYLLRLFGGRRR
jgi:FtsH-binding integral membrane protein